MNGIEKGSSVVSRTSSGAYNTAQASPVYVDRAMERNSSDFVSAVRGPAARLLRAVVLAVDVHLAVDDAEEHGLALVERRRFPQLLSRVSKNDDKDGAHACIIPSEVGVERGLKTQITFYDRPGLV